MPRNKCLAFLSLTMFMVLSLGALVDRAESGPQESAWEAMLRANPGLADDSTVGPFERHGRAQRGPTRAPHPRRYHPHRDHLAAVNHLRLVGWPQT